MGWLFELHKTQPFAHAVTNPNLEGIRLDAIPGRIGAEPGITFELAGAAGEAGFRSEANAGGHRDVRWSVSGAQQRHPFALSRTPLWLRHRRGAWLSRWRSRSDPAYDGSAPASNVSGNPPETQASTADLRVGKRAPSPSAA